MLKKAVDYLDSIKGKKIAVVGMGISNRALLDFLSASQAKISLFDANAKINTDEIVSKYQDTVLSFYFGKNYLAHLQGFDIIFKAPVIRPDIPEFVAEEERGAQITSEMELFFELCPCEIFAVTGSDGKTTTTTLIYRLLKEEGYTCWLGGNIGTPLINRVNEIKPSDKVVLELSSFQLMAMKARPNTSVLLNVTPNHLDVHRSMEEYFQAKKNIFRYQTSNDRTVLNQDCSLCASCIPECGSKVITFSMNPVETGQEGLYIQDGRICRSSPGGKRDMISIDEIKLPGRHNLQNYMAAIAAVADHVSVDAIMRVAHTFNGVEHRMEHVASVNGIDFYNDSIGSSPTRTIAGLEIFDKKVILIAGGYDKHLSYEELGKVILNKVKTLILIGQTAPKIKKAVEEACAPAPVPLPLELSETLEAAVNRACQYAHPGDIVILSPASASFDMFKNFEERGNAFKEIVKRLQNVKFYNKLVRDRIPEIIENSGEKAIVRILDDAEYKRRLEDKLDEEIAEYHESKELEELADILEVVYALCEAQGDSIEELMRRYYQKHEERGGFSKKIFLVGKHEE